MISDSLANPHTYEKERSDTSARLDFHNDRRIMYPCPTGSALRRKNRSRHLESLMVSLNAGSPAARKSPVTHLKFTQVYLLNGVDAASALLVDHTDPVKLIETSIDSIHEVSPDRDLADLTALRDVFAASVEPGQRGRKPAQVGETRNFKAQQVGDDGDVFLRLNLSTLGAVKGQLISAKFMDGQIKVTIAKAE